MPHNKNNRKPAPPKPCRFTVFDWHQCHDVAGDPLQDGDTCIADIRWQIHEAEGSHRGNLRMILGVVEQRAAAIDESRRRHPSTSPDVA